MARYTPSMKLIKLLLLCVAMGAGVPAMAQWQWVDKDGRKVFSDRPPGLDVPEKNILKRPKGYGGASGAKTSGTGPALRDVAAPEDGESATPAEGAATAAAKPSAKGANGKDKELETKKAAEDKVKADADKAAKEKQATAKADNCKRAQQAKAMYDTGKAVRMPNEKGEMVFQNAEQRATEVKRTDEAIFNNC